MEWWHILLIVFGSLLLLFVLSIIFYKPFFKRFWDIVLSGLAIIVIFPLLVVLAFVGAIAMKGNPFFIQERPGKKEKIFKLIKFRSMNNKKDENGELLPDEKRLGKYGKFIRTTSLDELPELINVFVGDMSIVGPRPLLVKYLDRYTSEQHRRHLVRPGLTGLAMSTVRNSAGWDKKFELDLKYVDNVSFWLDLKIIFWTIKIVATRKGINEDGYATNSEFKGEKKE